MPETRKPPLLLSPSLLPPPTFTVLQHPGPLQAIAVSCAAPTAATGSTRTALIWDVRTRAQLMSLSSALAGAAAGGGPGSPHAVDRSSRAPPAACFDPTGNLVLWGASLWDIRAAPKPLHTFDVFSDGGAAAGAFHPVGREVVLNSEVSRARESLSSFEQTGI